MNINDFVVGFSLALNVSYVCDLITGYVKKRKEKKRVHSAINDMLEARKQFDPLEEYENAVRDMLTKNCEKLRS